MLIVWIIVGVLIGWNLPQPEFAKRFQAWTIEKVKGWIK